MKTIQLLTYISYFLFSVQVASSQGEVSWRVLMHDPTVSYHEVVQAFERQTAGKDLSKIKGSGKFKLYKNYFEKKVDDLGYYDEKKARLERDHFKTKDLSKSNKTANWEYIGLDTPLDNLQESFWLGRVDRVAFHPSDPDIIWAGTPAGGLWKSEDAAQSWSLISDSWPNLGIGDIVIDSKNPDNIYVATGDSDSWFFDSYGIQISRDGGDTWQLIEGSIARASQIYRLIIDHTDSDILYCATERGLYKSTDAGMSWQQIEGIEGRVNDIEIHPADHNILHLVTTNSRGWSATDTKYQTKSQNFDFNYYRSIDGGETFERIDIGYESTASRRDDMVFGRIAVSPDNPDYVYIAGYADEGNRMSGLYKSTDGGLSFQLKESMDTFEGTIGAWTMHIAANPTNADEVIVGSVTGRRTLDGGDTWTDFKWPDLLHVDIHDIQWHPSTGRLFIANDGGLEYQDEQGNIQFALGIEVGQYAEMSSSPHGDMIIGGLQDNGTRIKLPNGQWSFIVGGDGMSCVIDPVTERDFYASAQLGWTVKGSFTDERVENWQGMLFADQEQQLAAWETMIRIHPFKNNVIYIPLEDLYISEDFGNSFEKSAISAFTANNPPTIFEISETNPSYMYMSDGRILTRSVDGGESWTVMNRDIQISSLTIDDTDPDKIWISQWGIKESRDGGRTFIDLPRYLSNQWANYVVHQPGSEDGLYALANGTVGYIEDGMNEWVNFSTGLPHTSYNSSDIDIISSIGKIRISTWGRGIWESDLYNVDNDYLKRIPKPPVLSSKNCGTSIELRISTDEEYDHVEWYKNDQYITTTSELIYIGTEAGEWGARLINGKQKSYLSNTIQYSAGSSELIGPEYVCEGSTHFYYFNNEEGVSPTEWNVPQGWKSGESDNVIGVNITSSDTLRAVSDVGCGVINYQKDINIVSECSEIVLDLDGEDDYIRIPSGLIDDVSDYTIETWFRLDHLPQSHFSIYDLGEDWNARVNLRVEGENLRFVVSNWERGYVGNSIESSRTVEADKWYHVAVSYRSSDRIATMYMDGDIVGQEAMLREPKDLFSRNNLFIGRSLDYRNNTYLDGQIDEFRFWTRARDEKEIKDHMSCTLSGNEADLEVYYSFSNGKPSAFNRHISSTTDYNSYTGKRQNYDGQLINFSMINDGSNFIGVTDLELGQSCIQLSECSSLNPNINVSQITCHGESNGSIVIENASYTYLWSDGSSEASRENLASGEYEVTISDDSGCSEVKTISISEPMPISTEINQEKDSVTSVEVLVDGGTPPYSYSWSDDMDRMSNVAMNLEAGRYTVTVTDLNGCSISSEFMVSTTTSINEIDYSEIVKLYPNPSDKSINIEIIDFDGFQRYEIYNLKGELIKSSTTAESIFAVDISSFDSGMYFLKLKGSKEEATISFTKM